MSKVVSVNLGIKSNPRMSPLLATEILRTQSYGPLLLPESRGIPTLQIGICKSLVNIEVHLAVKTGSHIFTCLQWNFNVVSSIRTKENTNWVKF